MEQIYSVGRVYAIKSHNSDKVYIGSTTKTLDERLDGHIQKYGQYLKGKVKHITSFDVLKDEKVYIELVEEYEQLTRSDLFKHEGEYIKKLECVNKVVAGRTMKEYNEDNHEKIQNLHHEYYMKTRDKRREKYKENLPVKPRTDLGEKITCECGATYLAKNKDRHINSMAHETMLYCKENGI